MLEFKSRNETSKGILQIYLQLKFVNAFYDKNLPSWLLLVYEQDTYGFVVYL